MLEQNTHRMATIIGGFLVFAAISYALVMANPDDSTDKGFMGNTQDQVTEMNQARVPKY